MKITPVMTGSQGAFGAASLGHTSPERIESATKVALGIKPSDTPVDPQVTRAQETMRKIKMKTNYSPDRTIDPTLTSDINTTSQQTTQSAQLDNNEGKGDEDIKLSPQAVALAKARRALQLDRANFIKEKAEFDAFRSQNGDGAQFKASLKENPLKVLLDNEALTPEFYNQLTEYLSTGQAQFNDEKKQLLKRIDDLEKGINDKFTSRENQEVESALTQMLFDAENLAKDGDTYELIRTKNGYDRVLRKIYQEWKKTGAVLDLQSVMNDVENELLQEYESWQTIPKVKAKYFQTQTPVRETSQPQMRTLTNRDTARAPLDRRTRAILAAMGQLNR